MAYEYANTHESLNGKLKDELIHREIFYSLREVQVLVEQWRREYNTIRPHSLGYRPPAPQAIRPARAWLRRPAGARAGPEGCGQTNLTCGTTIGGR